MPGGGIWRLPRLVVEYQNAFGDDVSDSSFCLLAFCPDSGESSIVWGICQYPNIGVGDLTVPRECGKSGLEV